MNSPALLEILKRVANGHSSIEDAAQVVEGLAVEGLAGSTSGFHQTMAIEGATIDLGRRQRCGFGEVIYGEGKTTELIARIAEAQLSEHQDAFITRLEPTAAAQLRRAFSNATYNSLSRTMRIRCKPDDPVDMDANSVHVAVVSAGSTDAPVAEEAAETLNWMKIPHRRYCDMGVAGPQRLLSIVPQLRLASVIVVVAGMEGALPSALAGHVASPVIAVPTSSGYGANLHGLTPLMGMLTSCAANIAVVNIDAGFKGGYVAGLIAQAVRQANKTSLKATS